MADIIVFPKKEDISLNRSKLIDALLDIRLTLSVKKITSNLIMKSELKKIVDDTKEKVQILEVQKAIDEVFDEYLNKTQVIESSNQSLSIEQMQKAIDDEAFGSSSNDLGRTLIKTDAHQRKNPQDGFWQDNNAA